MNKKGHFIDSHKEVPNEVSLKVLGAIQRALREEKQPPVKRIAKALVSTLACLALLGVPFFFSFKEQLNTAWIAVFGLWGIYFLVGFLLLFRPQPRLVLRGVWSPFIVARLLLVSTASTILQIILCPSFVFLTSPLEWNPLTSVTDSLMKTGGMNLCMFFCGFIFSIISGGLGLLSVATTASAKDTRSVFRVLSILFVSQVPILLVQVLSPDLREYSLHWLFGLLFGFVIIAGALRLLSRIVHGDHSMNRFNSEEK